ncbi:MAG TPA: type I restriction endonuclease [Thermoanaerobaculia bacterium]|nr:type I restriction endonuclease [Thermoanaerobaculia bacterium]
MDFADRIRELSSRIPQQMQYIRTEEATKNALVMPFISALGYNVFDPLEVTPELDADVGIKKGEKVDYAILKDGKPIILFECKAVSANLDEVHASQLYRYFSVTDAKIGVLTNGIIYRFFSDLEATNKMDSKPFLEVNLLSSDEITLGELKKFSKASFELAAILANASDLKYTREIKKLLNQEINQPSEEFVRFFTSKVYQGRMTQSVREQFTEITKKALQQFISDKVSDRLKSALAQEEAVKAAPAGEEKPEAQEVRELPTEDELNGFYIVRAILTQLVDPQRVVIRDQKSYCSVLLDDSNRKPICRLWFNGAQKYIGLFDAAKLETRKPIENLAAIYSFSDQLRETVGRYESKPERTGGSAGSDGGPLS